MKLGVKLTVATTFGIAVVLGVYSTARVQREAAVFEREMRADHRSLGTALALAAELIAERSGPEAALGFLREANARRTEIEVRFVSAPSGEGGDPENLQARMVDLGTNGETASLVSRVPMKLGEASGFIELKESLSDEQTYIRQTIHRTAIMALVIVVLCALIIHLTGWYFIGRPVEVVVTKLHRIARGDLGSPLAIRQRDEIGTIAREINAMCDELGSSQRALEAQTQARIAALEQLRHADRLSTVGQLASGIAHELGTPLNVVSARATAIARGRSTGSDAVEDGGIIAEQVERMSRIIRQLLDFARRRVPATRQEDLDALLERVVRVVEPLAKKSGVVLSLERGEIGSADVDEGQMQQVLTNLIVNAIQAQPGGGVVKISSRRLSRERSAGSASSGEHIEIVVEDSGPGMPEEVRARVFEPFFTTKDVGQGTGLGLSLAFGIVRDHGGTIEVESEPGRGSRFRVLLTAVRGTGQEMIQAGREQGR